MDKQKQRHTASWAAGTRLQRQDDSATNILAPALEHGDDYDDGALMQMGFKSRAKVSACSVIVLFGPWLLNACPVLPPVPKTH